MTSDNALFQIRYGRQEFGRIKETVQAYALRVPTLNDSRVEWSRKNSPKALLTPHGKQDRTPASIDHYKDHGYWYTSRYYAPSQGDHGVVVGLMYTRRIGKEMHAQCCIHLLVTGDTMGPHVVVNCPLVHNSLSSVNDNARLFYGRGYLLSPDDMVAMGIDISPSHRSHFMEQEEVEEEFEVVCDQPERLSVNYIKTPATHEGDEPPRAVPVAPAPIRRMRVRR